MTWNSVKLITLKGCTKTEVVVGSKQRLDIQYCRQCLRTEIVLRWWIVTYCVPMQLGGDTDRRLADPLSMGLSTTSGANKVLQPVSELEAVVSDEGGNKVSLDSEAQRRLCLKQTVVLPICLRFRKRV